MLGYKKIKPLKCCPHCGYSADLEEYKEKVGYYGDIINVMEIRCSNEDCFSSMVIKNYSDSESENIKSKLIKAWNRRI